jgi:Putative DNA-binding domain
MPPPSLADLLHLAADEVTHELLNQLIAEETLEGFTLEYKRELGNGTRVLEAITAQANTWGGLILVGIDEKRDSGTGFGAPGPEGIVGVEPKDRARLANMCSTRLVPPFDPLIHAVDVGDGRVVLVVRVYNQLAPRPITVDNRVLVRTDAGNRLADLFRLRSLFNDAPAGVLPGILNISNATPSNHPSFHENPPADLVVRAVAAIPILPTRSRPRLTDAVRTRVRESMVQATINEWLSQLQPTSATGGQNFNPWLFHGPSTSSRAELRWEGLPVFDDPQFIYPEARLALHLPSTQLGTPSRLNLDLDIIIRAAGLRNHLDPNGPHSIGRLEIQQLFHLFEQILSTFVQVLRPALVEHIGAPTGSMSGPHVGLQTNGRPISEAVNTWALQPVRGNEPGAGAELLPAPELNWADPGDRRQQAVEWLRDLLLDLGFQGVDRVVDQFAP